MSGGMVGVLNEHMANKVSRLGPGRVSVSCECGSLQIGDDLPPALMTAHVADELTKAGFGNVQEALLIAADAMEADPQFRDPLRLNSDRLRMYAHSLDPKGRALVQAIHDRKAEG